jgi:hypothetical protein
MQTPDPVRAVPAFQFFPTQPSDIESIELIASRSTRRTPAGLLRSLEDPQQRLVTVWGGQDGKPEVVGFIRFKLKQTQLQWTDLIVDPEYLDAKDFGVELKRGILEQAKRFASESIPAAVSTLPGLMTAPWKRFVHEQAATLGYQVEPGSKTLVLRF